MQSGKRKLIVFTDLDGCLLNKHDYDWSAAAGTLQELRRRAIPVVLNSSKTVAEMRELSSELGLDGRTIISENGGVICWGKEVPKLAGSVEVIGSVRRDIVRLLGTLKDRYQFRSFEDMGLDGVMEETQLPRHRASLAMQRESTEPLIWEDTNQAREDFESVLHLHGFHLTKGGRFWHVAGDASKGTAMQKVTSEFLRQSLLSSPQEILLTAAVGDSPIDQSMLDVADVPIGIPTDRGLGVRIDARRGIAATLVGAAGWAEAVTRLLREFDEPSG
ncbi:MAG: HAD-IIB family hydrolase [Planctomycetaceae bacterium]